MDYQLFEMVYNLKREHDKSEAEVEAVKWFQKYTDTKDILDKLTKADMFTVKTVRLNFITGEEYDSRYERVSEHDVVDGINLHLNDEIKEVKRLEKAIKDFNNLPFFKRIFSKIKI